jgi:1-phosphatidylinositol-4-phosphate 5-kinase
MVSGTPAIVNHESGSDIASTRSSRRRYGMYFDEDLMNQLDKVDSPVSLIASSLTSPVESDQRSSLDKHSTASHLMQSSTSIYLNNTGDIPYASTSSFAASDMHCGNADASLLSTPGATPDGRSVVTMLLEDDTEALDPQYRAEQIARTEAIMTSATRTTTTTCTRILPTTDGEQIYSRSPESLVPQSDQELETFDKPVVEDNDQWVDVETQVVQKRKSVQMRRMSRTSSIARKRMSMQAGPSRRQSSGASLFAEKRATVIPQEESPGETTGSSQSSSIPPQPRKRYSMGSTALNRRSSTYHQSSSTDSYVPAGPSTPRAVKRQSLRRRATYNVGPLSGRRGVERLSRPSSGIFDNVRLTQNGSANDDLQNWEAATQQLRARKTMRRKRSLSQGRSSEETRVQERIIGNPIKEGHVNYVLMYNMLTGIRVAVSRCTAKAFRELVDADFVAAHKLAFDITGGEMTPSSKYDFKFKDYAPWVFRHIRRKFGITSSDYLVSLTSRYILSELGSPGKSGSFFYFSQDYRFIIKTIHHSEHKFFRKILRHYWEHVKQNPHTLISRFFGLHRVKMPHGRKIHFVVMSNINPPNRDIHETYDLKGSTVGRVLSEKEIAENPHAPMKDLNWIQRGRRLEFGPKKREILINQLERDVDMLRRLNIKDYSLLVGLHDLSRGNKDNLRQAQLSVFRPGTEQLPGNADQQQKISAVRKAVVTSDPAPLDPEKEQLHDDAFDERRLCIFQQDEGGFQGTDDLDRAIDIIYYIGIIDILTPYTMTKRIEHIFKSIGHDRKGISAVNPDAYGRRFLNFVINTIRSAGEGRPSSSVAPRSSIRQRRSPPNAANSSADNAANNDNTTQSDRMTRVHTS